MEEANNKGETISYAHCGRIDNRHWHNDDLFGGSHPDITSFSSSYKLKAATREVETYLQPTQLLVAKENKTFQPVFGTNSYWAIRLSDGSVAKCRNFGPEYSDINLTNVSITFDPHGLSNGNTVTVANARGAKNVSIGPAGRVAIE